MRKKEKEASKESTSELAQKMIIIFFEEMCKQIVKQMRPKKSDFEQEKVKEKEKDKEKGKDRDKDKDKDKDKEKEKEKEKEKDFF